jgi:hypothetical protein
VLIVNYQQLTINQKLQYANEKLCASENKLIWTRYSLINLRSSTAKFFVIFIIFVIFFFVVVALRTGPKHIVCSIWDKTKLLRLEFIVILEFLASLGDANLFKALIVDDLWGATL